MSDEQPTEKLPNESVKPSRGPYKTKAPSRGGARANSGRPKGSTNKITAEELIAEFKQCGGGELRTFIVNKILEADRSNNAELVHRYLMGITRYVIQDKQEVDITTAGQPLQAAFSFMPTELPEWKQDGK
jgi:hypothetical protein